MLLFVLSVALADTPVPDHARGWLLGGRAAKLDTLDANPYANTDFTAYTVEQGEARIGPGEVAVGVLPRLQLATSPVFDALGVWNLRAKVGVVRAGPADLGMQAGYYHFDGETMTARCADVTATVSERLAEPWSLHGGLSYGYLQGEGTPNLDPIAPIFGALAGWNPSDDTIASTEERLTFDGRAHMLRARVATDVRLNRRDSFILQGEAMVWGDSDFPVTLPASVIGGAAIPANAHGGVAVADAYAASLAYQASFRHLDLRVGIGRSTIPGAWLMQSFALDYRFGGASRRSERLARTSGQQVPALARAEDPS